MKLTLKDFQFEATREVLGRLRVAKVGWQAGQRQAVGLTATTGAGKTMIATAVIEAILFGSDDFGVTADPGAVFLWMTDKPELNAQTQSKMLDASSDLLRFDLVPEITNAWNAESLAPGRVYFLNTQKLGAKADLVKAGPLVGRHFTFWDVVRKTIEDPERTLYLVVDEAHRGMTESRKIQEANSIIQRFVKGYPEEGMPAVPIVLGISATLARFQAVVDRPGRTTSYWEVPADQVRASGLIKDRTLADYAYERQHDAMALFPEAVTTWKACSEEWATYHAEHGGAGDDPLVVPALIIQVENEAGGRVTATDLDAVINSIVAEVGPLPDAAFAHSFGTAAPEPVGGRVVRYIEASKIATDCDARVIFFKSSLDVGWDCPRAEVMFSFRRAVDPTSIAQTIGRMVRAPLARRIEENDDLNAAYVFLPYYEETGVKAVIKSLNETGNEAIGGTVAARRQTISLPLRTDMPEAVAAIRAVPSYLVPTPRSRPEIRTLADLASFLSATGLDPDAFKREMGDIAALLIAERDAMGGDLDFVKQVSDEGEILVKHAELVFDEEGVIHGTTRTLPATEESIGRLFAAAARCLTNDVASAYVRRRLAQDTAAIGVARREAYVLSTTGAVMDAVNAHASSRIDALRQQHGKGVEAVSPSRQTRYKAILRQVPAPSIVGLKLPDAAFFSRGTESLPRHVYADGVDACIYLNSWEKATIEPVADRDDTIGWLRNGDREGWAFCVPWLDGSIWRGFFPDFLVARKDGDRIVVDILDPHDHTKPDAVGKAKGLSMYAAKHGDVLGHVDLVAKVGAKYRRLHLDRSAVRNEVDAISTNAELLSLYNRLG